jgi:TonB family protein
MTFTDSSQEFALQADQTDPLRSYRDQFHLPKHSDGSDIIYFCGNSLGLQPKAVEESPQEETFVIVEKMPEFPGGPAALMQYLNSKIKYPEECRKMGVEGKVFIKFVVDKEGIINQVAVLRGVSDCNLLEKEALRVVRSMPKWTPGKQHGKAVNVYFTLPISFKLSHDTEAK